MLDAFVDLKLFSENEVNSKERRRERKKERREERSPFVPSSHEGPRLWVLGREAPWGWGEARLPHVGRPSRGTLCSCQPGSEQPPFPLQPAAHPALHRTASSPLRVVTEVSPHDTCFPEDVRFELSLLQSIWAASIVWQISSHASIIQTLAEAGARRQTGRCFQSLAAFDLERRVYSLDTVVLGGRRARICCWRRRDSSRSRGPQGVRHAERDDGDIRQRFPGARPWSRHFINLRLFNRDSPKYQLCWG